MTLSRQRVEYASEVFLASMRRAFIKRYPDRECPIKGSLSEYSEADRGALMNAVSDAIKSSNPAADGAFAKWAEKRSA